MNLTNQKAFSKNPERFEPVNVIGTPSKFILTMVDPKILIESWINQAILPSSAVGVNKSLRVNLSAGHCPGHTLARICAQCLLKTNGKSPHGERPVSLRARSGILSMANTPRILRGRFPVKGSQSGFYSPAQKESSLETFSHEVSFEGDRVGVVDEPVGDGVGQRGFSDALVPEVDRILAGDQGGAGLPSVFEDVEEIKTLILGDREKTQVI